MRWKLTHSEFETQKGSGNRQAMQELVEGGTVPGLLAYCETRPVGWCAVSPREEYARLSRSRILKPIDHEPVWSIVCLFVTKDHRRTGVSEGLIRAATRFAMEQGARIVEGYPVEPKQEKMPDVFAFHGLASTFRKAGFTEMARRSDTRPIMRWHLPDSEKPRLKLVR
jgi:GNAT superfamily N-acetyltransferase